VVALLLPLDAIGILKKLSMDAGEVEQLVALSGNASTFGGWFDQWWKAVASPSAILGILLSTGLMSLGAPFWFDAIKNLFRLRPSAAQKESGERAERAAAQTAPLTPVLRVSPESPRPDGQASGANAGG
jgi:hypothetical protein